MRAAWSRCPLTLLQAPHSSCRFSMWSVPPALRGTLHGSGRRKMRRGQSARALKNPLSSWNLYRCRWASDSSPMTGRNTASGIAT